MHTHTNPARLTHLAPKILVVSPNQKMGERRHRLLTAAGYDATTLHSAEKAFLLLQSNAYEALILGQMLSYLEKRRLIEQARLSETPVIVLHVLLWDDSQEGTISVRITGGADGLLNAIQNAIENKSTASSD